MRIRSVEYEGEELYEAYSEGSDDGNSGEDDGEIQHGDRVASSRRRGIERHHESAVCRVEETHSSGKEDRET